MSALDVLPDMWVVYDHPEDYPDKFVARLWSKGRPSDRLMKSERLNPLRDYIRGELTNAMCLPRYGADNPVIVEVWI